MVSSLVGPSSGGEMGFLMTSEELVYHHQMESALCKIERRQTGVFCAGRILGWNPRAGNVRLDPGAGVWLVGWAGQTVVKEDRIFRDVGTVRVRTCWLYHLVLPTVPSNSWRRVFASY